MVSFGKCIKYVLYCSPLQCTESNSPSQCTVKDLLLPKQNYAMRLYCLLWIPFRKQVSLFATLNRILFVEFSAQISIPYIFASWRPILQYTTYQYKYLLHRIQCKKHRNCIVLVGSLFLTPFCGIHARNTLHYRK